METLKKEIPPKLLEVLASIRHISTKVSHYSFIFEDSKIKVHSTGARQKVFIKNKNLEILVLNKESIFFPETHKPGLWEEYLIELIPYIEAHVALQKANRELNTKREKRIREYLNYGEVDNELNRIFLT